jgi:KDO2-lipid IV(A) lauroyltransferase
VRRRNVARDRLLAFLIAAVGGVFRFLPTGIAVRIGALLGTSAYRVLGRDRRRAHEHLGMAFPGLPPEVRARHAREAFGNAGRAFAELAHWPRLRARLDAFVVMEGIAHIDRALAQGRGLIAVTGHVGNWELLGATFAHRGYPLTVVARRVNGEGFEALLSDFRTRVGVQSIERDDPNALRHIVRALRAGGIVALLVDQDTRGPGVYVPFFGRMAHTSPAPAIIALRTQAPVATVFIERRRGGHRIRIEPLYGFDPAPGRRPNAEELTARITAAIEEQIRRRPDEWVWWHRRWRRQPPAGLRIEQRE